MGLTPVLGCRRGWLGADWVVWLWLRHVCWVINYPISLLVCVLSIMKMYIIWDYFSALKLLVPCVSENRTWASLCKHLSLHTHGVKPPMDTAFNQFKHVFFRVSLSSNDFMPRSIDQLMLLPFKAAKDILWNLAVLGVLNHHHVLGISTGISGVAKHLALPMLVHAYFYVHKVNWFYIRVYLPTIRWQLGHVWMTSLQASTQNGIRQQPKQPLKENQKIFNYFMHRGQNNIFKTYIFKCAYWIKKKEDDTLPHISQFVLQIAFKFLKRCLY